MFIQHQMGMIVFFAKGTLQFGGQMGCLLFFLLCLSSRELRLWIPLSASTSLLNQKFRAVKGEYMTLCLSRKAAGGNKDGQTQIGMGKHDQVGAEQKIRKLDESGKTCLHKTVYKSLQDTFFSGSWYSEHSCPSTAVKYLDH